MYLFIDIKRRFWIGIIGFLPLLGYAQPGKVEIQVKNEAAVNSPALEFSPNFYEDGIVFISTNKSGLKKVKDKKISMNTMSILRSKRNAEGELSKPEPFAKELSSEYHEGPVCFDRTAEVVYFSQNININGREKHAHDGIQKQKIYMSTKTGETWGAPVPLPFNTDEFDDCHPSISIDGDKIFFASNRPGGFGGMDLYVAYKVGESWSEPVNLGQSINTAGNEAFPFIHADNTLYYASDGMTDGKGGFDIYFAAADGTNWTAPVNIGTPFNTPSDDLGLIVDLDKINGYYSSNGNGGLGADDIFSFHVENGNLDDYLLQNSRAIAKEVDLLVMVYDKETNQPIPGAEIRIINQDQNNAIGRDSAGNLIILQNVDGQDVMKVIPPDKGVFGTSDAGGRFTSNLKAANYIILVAKEGYQTRQNAQKIIKKGTEYIAVLEKIGGKVKWNTVLYNDLTDSPLAGSTLILTNKATGKIDTVYTDANGMVDYYLDSNSKYNMDIYQGGRLIGNTEVNTAGWAEDGKNQMKMTLNITPAALPSGTVIELPLVYYNYNDATLRPDARKDLDLLVSILRTYPTITIELGSHTDSRGTDSYNLQLSQRRAQSVVDYLASQEIDVKRLKAVGYGEGKLRNKCKDGVPCTEKEHARNRRTEVTVLSGADGVNVKQVEGKIAPGPGTKVNTAPGSVSMNSIENSDFYVIVGSFLMENRAVNQLERLTKGGYANATLIQFPKSPYFSVCAGKFENPDQALSLKNKIESGLKLEAFVKPVPR